MLKNYIISLVLLFQINLFAQTPCDSATGMAGDYPCNDYDLMSRIPTSTLGLSGSGNGSDIWGWTDPLDNKEYAIVGLTNSTAFVDITDPVNPIFLGRINTAAGSSAWRDVKVYNNHAFIVADNVGSHGMQVFDLTILRDGVDSDLTYGGSQVLKYTGDGGGSITIGSCHNIVINEAEGVAYLVGCSSANGGGPIFVDITDPANPTTLGDYTAGGYSHDAQVVTYNGPDTEHVGKQIYIGSNGNSDKVVILDVTDKNNIVSISQFSYPQISYAHQGWFTDDHKYFLLGDEGDEQSFGFNTKTLIFDFTDLDNPSLSSTYLADNASIDHNGYVLGDKFYLASYRAGLRVLDITNISASSNSMTEIGYFDTYPSSNNANFGGAWSIYPYFSSGNIIISDSQRGLFVVRKSGTLSTPDFEIEANGFSLSPNPTTSSAIVKSLGDKNINTITIHNLLGQKVFDKSNINQNSYTLPIGNYSKGIYLVKINNASTKKLIVK